MERFDPSKPCKKCGSTSRDLTFGVTRVDAEIVMTAATGFSHLPARTEHLSVACRTCGYSEQMKPLDAE